MKRQGARWLVGLGVLMLWGVAAFGTTPVAASEGKKDGKTATSGGVPGCDCTQKATECYCST